jgi:hypothetical protein
VPGTWYNEFVSSIHHNLYKPYSGGATSTIRPTGLLRNFWDTTVYKSLKKICKNNLNYRHSYVTYTTMDGSNNNTDSEWSMVDIRGLHSGCYDKEETATTTAGDG